MRVHPKAAFVDGRAAALDATPFCRAGCAACHSVLGRLQRAVPDNDIVRANAQAQLIPLRRTVMMILFAVAIFRAAPIPPFRAPASSRWRRVQRPSN
jgi:hypothetical protein